MEFRDFTVQMVGTAQLDVKLVIVMLQSVHPISIYLIVVEILAVSAQHVATQNQPIQIGNQAPLEASVPLAVNGCAAQISN